MAQDRAARLDGFEHGAFGQAFAFGVLAPVDEDEAIAAPLSFAERLAHMARRAASDEEAADAVRKALEEMLS